MLWIGDDRRIVLDAASCPVHAEQPILAANLPVIRLRIPVMFDASEEPFRARAIAGRSRRLRDGHQIFRAGKQEGIAIVRVPWDPSGGLAADAGDAQAPAQPKWAVPVAGAVNEIELWLESVATRRQRDRDREVAGAGVEIGREGLADAMQGTAALRQGDGLIAGVTLVRHGCVPHGALALGLRKL